MCEYVTYHIVYVSICDMPHRVCVNMRHHVRYISLKLHYIYHALCYILTHPVRYMHYVTDLNMQYVTYWHVMYLT